MINTMEDFKSKIRKTKNRVASVKYLKVKWQPVFLTHKKNTFVKRVRHVYASDRIQNKNTEKSSPKQFCDIISVHKIVQIKGIWYQVKICILHNSDREQEKLQLQNK